VVESGGRVIPGGHQQFAMAAKGLWDGEVTPGRTWFVTGIGANAKSCEMFSATQCFAARDACGGCKTLPWLGAREAAPACTGAAQVGLSGMVAVKPLVGRL